MQNTGAAEATKAETALELVPAGFFVLRTPLLPFEEFTAWGEGLEAAAALQAVPGSLPLEQALAHDRALLRARLRAAMVRPEIREALLLASPALDESISAGIVAPESERGQKAERTVVRYFTRMSGRATPFGLFAGCSLGKIGAESRLLVTGRARYGRHTRLDMDYLFSLTEALCRSQDIRPLLEVFPNSSLYRAGGRLRYAEARLDGNSRTYHLVAIEPTDYIEATIARAALGSRPDALARALCDDHPDIPFEEATDFIDELIDSQILVPDLAPAVTGPEPIQGLIDTLREHPTSETAAVVADRLEETRAALVDLDACPVGSGSTYRAIASRLEGLPSRVELSRLFQVDMTKPAPDASLGSAVLGEVARAIRFLHRTGGLKRENDSLARFREAFARRYEDREVPLVEALDVESGVGFPGGPSGDAAPLIAGLALPEAMEASDSLNHGFGHLLRRVNESAGALELRLDADDERALAREDSPPLPRAFAAMATVAAASAEALQRGEFKVHFLGTLGPSGANLLGRFCHGLPALDAAVKEYLAAEEALAPGAIFAEVVHLPEGRAGNVLLRPVLRGHEIAFLGRSGHAREGQIPITDLMVSVRGGQIVLRSAKLGREVVPRLTSAHNFGFRSLTTYRFLCSLQKQGSANLSWSWGALEAATFLPRVVVGNVVLALARWRLEERELKALAARRGDELFLAVQELRARLRLPRYVAIADDNVLPIDLDNPLSVDASFHLLKDRPVARLVELWPAPTEMCVEGPEGRFVHELVIPYLRPHPPSPTSSADERGAAPARVGADREGPEPPRTSSASARSFPPGSEWLYAKLYAGTAGVDQVLAAALPVVREALRTGAADRWFFIRYGDPDWHLRLRLHGDPVRLLGEVLPSLREALEPHLADGRMWRLQLDTYEQEVERYGGPEGVAICERIFFADSECVAAILETLVGDEGADARWRLALLGTDRLLGDLGFDLASRSALVTPLREEYAREHQCDVLLARQLGEKYRKHRVGIDALLSTEAVEADHPWAPYYDLLARRSAALREPAGLLRALTRGDRGSARLQAIARSVVHMHTNRFFRSAARSQELVLYDLLDRHYVSRAARARIAGRGFV